MVDGKVDAGMDVEAEGDFDLPAVGLNLVS